MTPPRLAHRLLLHRLAPDERDELIGDLDEQFRRRAEHFGAGAARRWYWRQSLALVWSFTMHRRDLISTAHERTRGRVALDNARLDWRHAWRSLRHSRSYALVALFTISFAIALSTTVFSLVSSILLQPLPVPDADRIVQIGEFEPARSPMFDGMINTGERSRLTLRDVSAGVWQAKSETLAAFAPISTNETSVRTPTETVRALVADVGPQFFDVYPLTPTTGRRLAAADDAKQAEMVAVVTERFWRQRLGSRDDVVDQFLTVRDIPARIVGVVPSTLDFLARGIDIFLPGRFSYPAPGVTRLFGMNLDITARMLPAVSIDQVRAEGQQVLRTVAMANPAFFDGQVAVPEVRAESLIDEVVAPVRPALTVLFAGMICVLVAGGANLASLLLSRNTTRSQEVALRLAIGASRWRILRPLLFEQLILGGAGAAIGGLAAWWAIRALPRLAPADLPRLSEVHFDAASLFWAAGAAIVTVVAVGVLPAWQISTRRVRELTSPHAGAAERGRAATTLRSALVFCQVALATVLLVGAGLIGRSLAALVRVDPGYDPSGVLTFQVATPERIGRNTGQLHQFYGELVDRLARHPGVVAAGVASTLPLHVGGSAGTVDIEGRPRPEPNKWPRAQRLSVSQHYLQALGTRLVRGRLFDERDTPASEQVCLINEVFADRYFAGEDPIGQRLGVRARVYARIVGVVAAIRIGPMSSDAPPAVITLSPQQPEVLGYGHIAGGVAVRTNGDPDSLVSFVRAQVRELQPEWPVHNVQRLDARLSQTFAQPRFYTIALTLFAILAIGTAVLGLYGVLSYALERRRVEFGIRRALGADSRQIVVLAARRSAVLAIAGVAAGVIGAAAASQLLGSVLFGVTPLDPITYAGAVLLVMAVVVVASWQPVRRALAVDPARALRVE